MSFRPGLAGTVDNQNPSGQKEFVVAHLAAVPQNANIGANDHLKFDTVDVQRGVAVSLDTSTAYSNAQGAASIGRFTLKGGRTYLLSASLPYILGSGATGSVKFQWWDATNNAAIGSPQTANVATDATNEGSGGDAFAIFQPGQDTLVELRLVTVTALTSVGSAGSVPVAIVETY